MIKLIVLIVFFPSLYTLNAQLSVPFNSLPPKAEMRIKNSVNTEGVLYASVHTDTVNGCRIWLFYDTLAEKSELKSILFEQFSKNRLSRNNPTQNVELAYRTLNKQLFMICNRPKTHINSIDWESRDFLMDGYGETDTAYLSFFKRIIQEHFDFLLPSISELFKKETLGAIRNFRRPPRTNFSVIALQLPPQSKDYTTNWLEIYFNAIKNDSFSLTQITSIGYETERLNREIKNNRLISMFFQGSPGESFERAFSYDKKGKLYQITDGNRNENGVMGNLTVISIITVKD